MTLVGKITHLRHPGVIRDFTWPEELPSFGRYNLIYGWNGSGKTTISNIFRSLELQKPPEGEVTLAIGNRIVTGNSFPNTEVPVKVFNRDFVSANVFPIEGGNVPPIFILGEENADKQAQAEKLKSEKSAAQNRLKTAEDAKIKADRSFDKHCIDRATVIRETLRSSGTSPYNNYDKGQYKRRAGMMLSTGDKASHLLTEEERDRLLSQSRATPKAPINEIHLRLPDLQQLTESTRQMIRVSVVSSAIASLKTDPRLSSWTRDGLSLHNQHEADHCLFCEQPLPESLFTIS